MCELHYYRCPMCGTRWQGHRKLASCKRNEPTSRCPESLCMYVGNPKLPTLGECPACTQVREALEEYGIIGKNIVTAERGQSGS
ncbi:hypothetical protein CMUS01_09352 [Colletotrichum musicola]|uniref:Uncharacterized protein n=1 Tax=Colletotrichum musicola TaxID=2175873 RepID=A0A8H6NBN1_9PEZI|nr:hypothetical protein CMUS01_09352 [Colletotrichum musicola]